MENYNTDFNFSDAHEHSEHEESSNAFNAAFDAWSRESTSSQAKTLGESNSEGDSKFLAAEKCSFVSADDPAEAAIGVLAGAQIRRNGDSVTATLPAQTDIATPGQDIDRIRFERTMTFNASINGNTIALTNIEGLSIDPGPNSPWLNVTAIRIEGDRATFTAGRFGIYADQTIDLRDGAFADIRTRLRNAGILP